MASAESRAAVALGSSRQCLGRCANAVSVRGLSCNGGRQGVAMLGAARCAGFRGLGGRDAGRMSHLVQHAGSHGAPLARCVLGECTT